MNKLYRGRFTAELEGPFVVFLIGMRVNRLWKFWEWVPVTRSMGPMLRELFTHPDKGMLGAQTIFYWRGIGVLQYWRSFEDLDRFARSADDPHLPAWKAFNRKAGRTGSVGIWHETYLVPAGRHETVYGNMPRFGLAAAGAHVPATGTLATARRRLGGEDQEAVPATY
ncbi:MAG: DUF4188 domain-containing protein [Candidatus Dormibacteraeota bacterium]|nr:DUF4188 domain-containing protein [Candidatus Dormibacteraeota bacterium]